MRGRLRHRLRRRLARQLCGARCLSVAKTCSIGIRSASILAGRTACRDRTGELANCFAPVAAEVIQADDTAGSKDGQENLLHIVRKLTPSIGPLGEPWRLDPAMAQGRQESHGLSATVGNLGVKPATARRPAAQGRHIGPGLGLVEEDQPLSFDAISMFAPGLAAARLGSIAFASRHAFLKLSFSACTKSHTEW